MSTRDSPSRWLAKSQPAASKSRDIADQSTCTADAMFSGLGRAIGSWAKPLTKLESIESRAAS
jgi:hypothetical protein